MKVENCHFFLFHVSLPNWPGHANEGIVLSSRIIIRGPSGFIFQTAPKTINSRGASRDIHLFNISYFRWMMSLHWGVVSIARGEESQYFMPLSIGWLLGLTKLREIRLSYVFKFVLQNIKMFPNDKITTCWPHDKWISISSNFQV